jgi:antitoxin component YwqK of YwqJK toxin-antitoxin module
MKTSIKFICILAMVILPCMDIFAQKEYADKINQFNDKGQKEGFWKEVSGNVKLESYYLNGKKSGIFKSFSQTGNLNAIGEYNNDEISGTWYYFGDCGHLMMIQKDFEKNSYAIPLEHRVQGVVPNKCYCTEFYPNGMKKSEGVLLWDENPESDFTFEYGEWKYYNESGELIKTKLFE